MNIKSTMQWIKNRVYRDQYYKITKEGDQTSVYDFGPYEYILHIHNNGTLTYHFIKDQYDYVMVKPYKVLGMNVHFEKGSYLLPPESFFIKGNELFKETLTLWLCKHYLRIPPRKKCTLTVIDENADMYKCNYVVVDNNLKNDIKCLD
jgi:hypothetical protein